MKWIRDRKLWASCLLLYFISVASLGQSFTKEGASRNAQVDTGNTYGSQTWSDPTNRSFISILNNKRKRADRYFNNFEYKSAIKLYSKLASKGKADDLVKLRLAESYLKINDLVNAEKWYAEVIHSDKITPHHQIQYAHTLLSNGKYEKAREVINSYEFADSDYRSQEIINTLNKLETSYADSTPDPEMILTDNSVNRKIPTIEQGPLAFAELSTSTVTDQIVEATELSTINALIVSQDNQVLSNTNIKFLVNGEEIETMLSDSEGNVSIQVPPDEEYTMVASKKGYEDRTLILPAESLGLQEDLLLVMNSNLIDPIVTKDQISAIEPDPLVASGEPWEDDKPDPDQPPQLEGVAQTELLEWPEETTEEVSATELDPLAVTDDGIVESMLDNSVRSEIDGAPLTDLDLPGDYEGAEDQLPTTELNMRTEDQIPTTGLDPLAVSEEAFEDSGLDPDQPTQLEGVALNAIQSQENKMYAELPSGVKLVETAVVDVNTREHLINADIKLFVDSPNQALEYELKDGVLTFEVNANEDYIIVASHDDYQDEYITLTGDELLREKQDRINLELTQTRDLAPMSDQRSGPSTKFKALVRDQETGEQISDAEVKFFVDGKAIESEYSKENGKTLFKSPQGEDYLMLVSSEGYQDLIYHLPGAPVENMDVDLSMYKQVDGEPYYPHRLLAIKGQAFDDFSGSDLNGVTFKVFENGDLIEVTDNLSALEMDPDNSYQVLAVKEGYLESLYTINEDQLESNETLVLPFGLRKEQISEVTGTQVNPDPDGQTYPVSARIVDITDDKPISEALVIVFADDQVQDKMNTWQTGMVTINSLPGKEYQLVVKREGYNDRIINVGQINPGANHDLQISLVPQEIQKLRHNEIDLSNANMLVMAGPNGEERLYLSTSDELYQYSVENENHYLVGDDKKILLKERTRSQDSDVTTKQDSDQFNLPTEDQFLYDQLSADEKAMIDKIAERLHHGELSGDPELAIYYNNLPEEYRNLAENLATMYRGENLQESEPAIASAELLNSALAENEVEVSKVFNINNIYYDFDKSVIREDAAAELDKLILIMKSNENIKVMMFSHTDSRGSNNYNEGLSKRRGMAAVQYLTERGISMDRLTVEGRGETQLVNPCTNSVNCPEEAHQLNRRTEFMLRS